MHNISQGVIASPYNLNIQPLRNYRPWIYSTPTRWLNNQAGNVAYSTHKTRNRSLYEKSGKLVRARLTRQTRDIPVDASSCFFFFMHAAREQVSRKNEQKGCKEKEQDTFRYKNIGNFPPRNNLRQHTFMGTMTPEYNIRWRGRVKGRKWKDTNLLKIRFCTKSVSPVLHCVDDLKRKDTRVYSL